MGPSRKKPALSERPPVGPARGGLGWRRPAPGRLHSFRARGARPTRGKVRELNLDRSCLVIDRQPTVRLGVRRLLASRYAVEEAPDWRRGLEMLDATGGFDVVIVDMNRAAGGALRGGPGAAAIRG